MSRILVLNGFGNNLGDQAIQAGTEILLDGHKLTHAFVYHVTFNEQTIARANREFDLILVGGGGLVYHRQGSTNRTGWGLDLPADLLPQLTVPIALFAAGYNYRRYSEPHFPAHMAAHFAAFCGHACHVSARDPHSRDRFWSIGKMGPEGRSRPRIVPDLSIHVDPLPVTFPGPTIAISLRLDYPGDRFAPPAAESLERFVRGLVEQLRPFRETHQFLYTPHIRLAADQKVGDILREELGAVALPDIMPGMYTAADTRNMPALYGVYQACDAVVGSRNHAVIIPLSVGTPVVSIASTESSRWLQTMHGDPEMHAGSYEDVGRVGSLLTRALAEREQRSAAALARRDELREVAWERTAEMLEGLR